jgi:peptidoglycan/xylan/chitin deacetylase (PgdA/CDA1 family)
MAIGSNLFSKGAQYIPLEWMRPLSGVSLVVPFYHVVSDDRVPHISHLYRFRTIAEFNDDLEFLLRHFQPVSLADIVDALNRVRALKKASFHLTFDDGFKEVFDIVAPILQSAGVPATFFLNTAFLDGGGLAHHNALSLLVEKLQSRQHPVQESVTRELESLLPPSSGHRSDVASRILSIKHDQNSLVFSLASILEVDLANYVATNKPYLSSAQVTDLMVKGFAIGAHSHSHPLYSNLSLSDQLDQTYTSINSLNASFGLKINAFAFPYNDDGVEPAFFTEIFSKSSLAVSFGTSGLITHYYPRNLQRVGMEKSYSDGKPIPASRILSKQFVRATYFRLRSPKPVASDNNQYI